MPETSNATYGVGIYGVAEYGEVVTIPIVPDIDAKYGIAIFGRSAYGLILTPAFSDPRNCLFSLEARKKIASAPPAFRGIYQTQITSKGRITRKLKLYAPANPQTEAQQANRAKITAAVLAWQGLTDEQKAIYNERAIGKPFTGYNIFVKEHLLSH